MEIVLALLLLGWGGFEVYESKQEVAALEEQQAAFEKELAVIKAQQKKLEYIYAPGKYIPHEGYYISNLSPTPQKAEGCDSPLLTTDLSKPRSEGQVTVSGVNVECQ